MVWEKMSGKIYDYFKPTMRTEAVVKGELEDEGGLGKHKDLEDETESHSSVDSMELVRANKRKRIEDDEGNSPKRRSESEEPLVKLNIVNETEAGPGSPPPQKKNYRGKNPTSKIDTKIVKNISNSTGYEAKDKNYASEESDDLKKRRDNKEDKLNGTDSKDDVKNENEDDDEIYEVDKVLDYAYCKQTEVGLYLVKWVGWDSDHNTWEPVDNLDCRDKLVEFYSCRLQQRQDSSSKEKRLLPLPPDPRDSQDLKEEFLAKHYSKPTVETLEKLYQLKKKGKTPKLIPEPTLRREIMSLATSKKVKEKTLEELRLQLNLRELDRYRTKQIADLKSWEERINLIEKDTYVSVVNDEDLDGPPTMMEYINSYKAGEGITIPDEPPLGCECVNCNSNSANCCSRVAGFELAYTSHGKLRVDIGYPIYECNKRCKCPPTCNNRVVQKGRTVKLAIYRTSNGCGWGVKALEKIKEGRFVVQYVGEVITSEEAECRGKKYDADGRTYLFDLDFNLGDENPYTVDAAFFGNLSHFINHSCDPNLSIFNVYINCLDPNLPQLCLFARRDINKGEQLTFDYCQSTQNLDNDDSGLSPNKTPLKTGTPGSKGMTPGSKGMTPGSKSRAGVSGSAVKGGAGSRGHKTQCRCGSRNCRKVLF